ncbi:MAG: histidine phosphatase family protein [Spirochaetia bacterium]|nr:histidine phosphatase family protein [Spirochaetia bacterium]
MAGRIILVRHGQSLWNQKNLFTGWVDVPLSPLGIEEALKAGDQLSKISFDIVFVSTLMRAMTTAMLALSRNASPRIALMQHTDESTSDLKKQKDWSRIFSDKVQADSVPVFSAWELNERYYGELQGMDKTETAKKYGDDQVKLWRRSYDVPPPNGESLKMTAERTIPYYQKTIEPLLKQGKTILVSAHGNSLRSIVMFLEKLTEEQVLSLELATGVPRGYHLSDSGYTRKEIADF